MLYMFTNENLKQYAVLKAMGATSAAIGHGLCAGGIVRPARNAPWTRSLWSHPPNGMEAGYPFRMMWFTLMTGMVLATLVSIVAAALSVRPVLKSQPATSLLDADQATTSLRRMPKPFILGSAIKSQTLLTAGALGVSGGCIMTHIIKRAVWVAAVGILGIGALTTGSSRAMADRLVYQCDEDGDDCRTYACDWDGDDCYPVRQSYGYRRGYYPPPYYAAPPRYAYPQPYYAPPSVGLFFGFGGGGHHHHHDDDDD